MRALRPLLSPNSRVSPALSRSLATTASPPAPLPYVARVSIANERKRNALSYDVLCSLESQLRGINPDMDIDGRDWLDLDDVERCLANVNRRCKVVVLESPGPVFCSGFVAVDRLFRCDTLD